MNGQIKSKAVWGIAWTGGGRIATQGIQFLLGLIIARMLMPSDYGIIGMLAIFMAISQTFLDSGFASALIQKKDRTDEDYSTVFWFNNIAAVILYAIIFISAPYIAVFYDMPVLTNVARVVSLSLIINGLSIVQTAKLTIDLNFRIQSVASISSALISGCIGLLLAYCQYGVWALVFQSLSASLIRLFIIWSCSRWSPSLRFSIRSFRQLFAFGSKILCSGLINTTYRNIYTLVIGKFFSPADVGFYNRGNHLALLPVQTCTDVLLKVNYPILSKLQDDNEQLINAYQKLLRTPLFLLYPLLAGIAALANPLVEIVLGEKWLPCVHILQILILAYMWSPLTHINLNLLYVKGRSDLVLKLELIKKTIAFAILFATIPFGIWWMCAGQAFYFFIAFVFNCHYTKRLLDFGFKKQIKELLPVILYTSFIYLFITFISSFIDFAWIKVLTGCITGAVLYLFMAYIFKDKSLRMIISHLSKSV